MQRLKRVLDVYFKKLTKEDWDSVLVIQGDEGISKSTLMLHIVEYWMTLLKGKCTPEDTQQIALDMSQFSSILKKAGKYDIIVNDEAAELSNKRSMSKLNVIVAQTYMIIRAENIFSILIIPSIFDLDGYFTKRRVRGLIDVYKRGKFAFYNRKKVREIVSINSMLVYKRVNVVSPLFRDNFPKYDGILLEEYKKKKAERMKTARDKLDEFLNSPDGKADTAAEAVLIRLRDGLGLTHEQLAYAYGKHVNTIGKDLRALKYNKKQMKI